MSQTEERKKAFQEGEIAHANPQEWKNAIFWPNGQQLHVEDWKGTRLGWEIGNDFECHVKRFQLGPIGSGEPKQWAMVTFILLFKERY